MRTKPHLALFEQYILGHLDEIRAIGKAGYKAIGRGAVLSSEGHDEILSYISQADVEAGCVDDPDPHEAETVRTYNPTTEVVIIRVWKDNQTTTSARVALKQGRAND